MTKEKMTKEKVKRAIVDIGIIPAIRVGSVDDALFAAEAVAHGGIPIVEVTMTIPHALDVIRALAVKSPEVIVGAGTVMDLGWARRSLEAGAKFLTSPGLDFNMVEFAATEGVVVFPGALTPSEVMAAAKAGADFVKIFPCAQVGGPAYIKALKGPFPEVPLLAAGGVNQQNAADFVSAGAAALGIGRDLIQPRAIREREGDWIRELARRFVGIVKDARAQMSELSAAS